MKRKRRKIKPRTRRTMSRSSHLPSSSAYSRRVNREKKKIFKQTVLLITVSIVVFLLFIFVIIPEFFQLTTNFFDSSTPFQEVDDIAPQVPIISAPLVATSSAKLAVTGFGEPESKLVLVLNGEKDETVDIADDGSFSIVVTLEEGNNAITAYSIDTADNESATTREYGVILDTQAPKLEVGNLEGDVTIEGRGNQDLNIQGETDKDAKIYINAHIVFPDDEGKFHYTVHLSEGENKFEVVAKDKAENTTKVELKIDFKL